MLLSTLINYFFYRDFPVSSSYGSSLINYSLGYIRCLPGLLRGAQHVYRRPMTRDLRLCIDPGHGGPGHYGAIWPPYSEAGEGARSKEAAAARKAEHASRADLVESQLALELALALEDLLECSGAPVIATLTRTTDERVTLGERHRLANMAASQLAISIHIDANESPLVGGLWTYVREGDDDLARAVATEIMYASPRALHRSNHRPVDAHPPHHWTGRAHNVLSGYACPAILVECGFSTNKRDRRFILSDSGRRQVVLALASGVVAAARLLGCH